MSIRLGGHIFSTPHCTVEESARIWRALGIEVMDLGNGRDLDPVTVASDPKGTAERVLDVGRRAGMSFHDAFPQATDKHITNTPDEQEYAHQRRVYEGWIAFAAEAGLNGISLSPGKYWAGLSVEEAYVRGREQLRSLARTAGERGVTLRIEPHVESVTWSPELALRMLDDVPGLSLTLDHSHFVFHGIPYEQIAVMHPHGTHWHARQAALGRLQTGLEQGEIDFQRIVGNLVADGYDGVIALEVVHTPWLQLEGQDVLGETVWLRDLMRDLLRQAGAPGWGLTETEGSA